MVTGKLFERDEHCTRLHGFLMLLHGKGEPEEFCRHLNEGLVPIVN